MRFCIGLFFLTLTGILAWNARDITAVVKSVRANAENSEVVTTNLRAVSVDLSTASKAIAEGIPSVMAAVNGKHGVREILLNVDKLTADARQTTITVKNSAAAEKTDIHEAMQAVVTTIEHAGGTLDRANTALGTLDTALGAIGREGGLVETATGTIAAAKNALESPQAARIQNNLADASDSWKSTSIHVDGASAKAEETVGYVHDMLKPKKLSFWGSVAASISSSIPGAVWNFLLRWKTQRVQVVNQGAQ